MNRVEQYRLIVGRLIEEYASYKPSHGQIETEAIIDRDKDHYEVIHVGWDRSRRVHGSVVPLESRRADSSRGGGSAASTFPPSGEPLNA